MNASDTPRSAVGATTDPPAEEGLRERKKRRTRQSIAHHALRLFAEQGYEATTVEQIAAAAQVSPSTFFRYYPSKEEVVLQDDYDPIWRAAVLARPAGEAPLAAVRNSLIALAPELAGEGAADLRARLQLVLAMPALRGRVIQNTAATTAVLADALAKRAGRDEPDYVDRVLAAASVGVAVVAILDWADSDTPDLEGLLRRGFAALSEGIPEKW